MKIQVDARLLHGGGIGRYIREIVGRWLAESSVERMRLFGRPAELGPWLEQHDARGLSDVVPWGDPPYSPAGQLRWPSLARRGHWAADITFFPHYDVPLWAHPTPSLVAIHDLIQFKHPEGFPTWKRAAGRMLLQGAIEKCAGIVTVSEYSRAAIEDFSASAAGKTRVVPNGVAAIFSPPTEEELRTARDRWAEHLPFVMTVGPAKRHKGLETAVRAVAMAREQGHDLALLMVGLRPGDRDRLAGAHGPDAAGWIVDTGPLGDGDLRDLYALCVALMHPSLAEGFGLVAVEALACGGRVLASRIPVTEEILGEHATFIPAGDTEAWRDGVLEAAASPRPRSVATPAIPRWDAAARTTLDIAIQVAGKS